MRDLAEASIRELRTAQAVPEAVLLRVSGYSSSSRAQSLSRCSTNQNASSAIRARSSPGTGQKQRHRRQVDCLQADYRL